jgi:hypothetical protein
MLQATPIITGIDKGVQAEESPGLTSNFSLVGLVMLLLMNFVNLVLESCAVVCYKVRFRPAGALND